MEDDDFSEQLKSFMGGQDEPSAPAGLQEFLGDEGRQALKGPSWGEAWDATLKQREEQRVTGDLRAGYQQRPDGADALDRAALHRSRDLESDLPIGPDSARRSL